MFEDYGNMESVTLTQKEFEALPEYSCSIPTGTTIGKRWKRNANAFGGGLTEDWYLCEYAEFEPPKPDRVQILTRKITFIIPDYWA